MVKGAPERIMDFCHKSMAIGKLDILIRPEIDLEESSYPVEYNEPKEESMGSAPGTFPSPDIYSVDIWSFRGICGDRHWPTQPPLLGYGTQTDSWNS